VHDFADTVVADRYTIEGELGRGGMATVWRARDLRHERFVAIKVLHPELAGAIGIDRFIREVRLTARLQHPNIVPILDSGVLSGADGTSLPWYAMPYLEGESLRTRLAREHQLPIDEALNITEAAGNALDAAHRDGIVHRDIKPENVFLSGGHVYVVDFGIAKALLDTGAEALTSTGLSIGTPAYMSPEQATAERIDARTDQYSLATVLYEMLAGEPPFSGPSAQSIVARRFAEPARPLRSVRSTVPETVERAILKALERAPADRFPDVRAFTAALRATASRKASRADRGPGLRRVLQIGVVLAVMVGAWLIASKIRVGHAKATDPEVVALYQRGVRGYDRRTASGSVDAVSAFSAAIARDSNYTPAWAGLAKSYVRAYGRGFALGGLSRDSILQRAVAAADRALATDSGSSDAWVTRSMVSRIVDPTDYAPVLRYARQGLQLDSTKSVAWQNLGITLSDMGNVQGGIEAWRRCVTLAPAYTECLAFLALAHYWRRQYDSAAHWGDSAVAVDPNYLLGRQASGNIAVERGDYLRAAAAFDAARRIGTAVEVVNSLAGSALVEARAGRAAAARAILRRADSLAASYVPAPLHTMVYLAQAHAALGEADQAMALLNRYDPARDLHFQLHLRCDPPFDPIRSDKRFRSLLVVPSPAKRAC
jgi:tetratricopeptide (TPR) repeat protein